MTDVTINIRISKKEKASLMTVAEVAGLSLSSFLRSAAVREAYRVIGPPKLIVTDGIIKSKENA